MAAAPGRAVRRAGARPTRPCTSAGSRQHVRPVVPPRARAARNTTPISRVTPFIVRRWLRECRDTATRPTATAPRSPPSVLPGIPGGLQPPSVSVPDPTAPPAASSCKSHAAPGSLAAARTRNHDTRRPRPPAHEGPVGEQRHARRRPASRARRRGRGRSRPGPPRAAPAAAAPVADHRDLQRPVERGLGHRQGPPGEPRVRAATGPQREAAAAASRCRAEPVSAACVSRAPARADTPDGLALSVRPAAARTAPGVVSRVVQPAVASTNRSSAASSSDRRGPRPAGPPRSPVEGEQASARSP